MKAARQRQFAIVWLDDPSARLGLFLGPLVIAPMFLVACFVTFSSHLCGQTSRHRKPGRAISDEIFENPRKRETKKARRIFHS